MTARTLVTTPERYDRPLQVLGTEVTVLAANAITQSYEITLQRGDEGTGPPPHRHAWDESFYVLEGLVRFTSGGQTVDARAGTLVHVPAGTLHGFQYGPGGGRMLEVTGAGGSACEMFAAVDAAITPTSEVPEVLEVLGRFGVSVG
jgi:quercetin dioxygenase-like cupin family protein